MNDEQTIAEKIGFDLLTDAEAAALSEQTANAIFANVAARAAAQLSNAAAANLTALIDKNASASDVHEFLREHIANFDHLVAEETAKLIASLNKE